ncbi:hypothetical protein UJ101_02485 [Flavobacteriaceae bacterium UJ101]|nr:hypothetical protein UJ101_02485 [Flavobacteriaceae bacterium UJ101]
MQNYKPLKKTRSNTQGIPNKGFIVYIVLGIIAFFIPFVHLFLSREDNKTLYDLFGFTSYYSMFFALGFPILVFIIGFFFYLLSGKIQDIYFRRFARTFGFACQLTSLFFITWALFPRIELENNDFPRYLYKVFSLIIALILSYTFYWLGKYFSNTESKLKAFLNYILFTRVKTLYRLAREDDFSKRANIVEENEKELLKTYKKVRS